jgi:hypothetical protein
MVPFLEGHNLFGYVDGTFPQPPKLVPNRTSGLLILNPDHSPWYHQDRIIFSAIISTLSVETLPHVIGLTTSREVWVTLETLFAAQSQSRILQLKQQLSNLKKDAQTVSAYFQKAQGIANLLAAIGKPVEDSELISNILLDWVLIMTPLLPLSQQGKILSLLLIFMATCYHMNCVWRLTKQPLISTSLLPTLLNVKVLATQGTIVAPIRATATLISLVTGGVAVVEDHLINIPFLARPNALHVKFVTS